MILLWWLVARSGFFFDYVFPTPEVVFRELGSDITQNGLLDATQRSLLRMAAGLGVAILVGTPIGLAMAGSKAFQRSVGSLMTGLQSLPSIAWAPLAMLWFGLNEQAVQFVVVIAGIPAVALATAASVRLVPPLLVRAGRTLGARRFTLYRAVILPAAVPGFVGGLQQAWALAWRALLAGELIVDTGARGIGHFQDVAFQASDGASLMGTMVVIVVIGIAVDFVLGTIDRRVRARRGLLLPTG